MTLAKAEGVHTCMQTSGAVSEEALLQVLDVVDLVQFDLKAWGPSSTREGQRGSR